MHRVVVSPRGFGFLPVSLSMSMSPRGAALVHHYVELSTLQAVSTKVTIQTFFSQMLYLVVKPCHYNGPFRSGEMLIYGLPNVLSGL